MKGKEKGKVGLVMGMQGEEKIINRKTNEKIWELKIFKEDNGFNRKKEWRLGSSQF